MEGLSVGPPSSVCTPRPSNSDRMPSPVTTASAPHTAIARGADRRASRCLTCARMSATSRWETTPNSENSAVAELGSSVWTCTLRVVGSPTTSTESPICSSSGTNRRCSSDAAGDGEVRAVAVRARRVLGMGDPRGGVVLERWRLAAAQRPDDPCQQDRQPVAAGVDDACLAQHRKQIGAAPDRLLTGCQRALDQLGEHLVLLRVGCVGAEPGVRSCARDRMRRARTSRARP